MKTLPKTKRAMGIQEWNDILMTMDDGYLDPDYVLPSAVWALAEYPSLAVQMGTERRWWCSGVIPGTGVQTDNESMRGYQEMQDAKAWIKQVGLQDQNFASRREALQAVSMALDIHGGP